MTGLPVGFAASAYTAPVALGGSWGSVGVGMIASQVGDASVSVAAGLGSPEDWVGLDVTTVFSSLSHSNLGEYGFGEEGSFAFKLHRTLGNYTAVAIGASAVAPWGGILLHENNPAGHYVVITRALLSEHHVLMLSGGAGHNVVNKNGNGNGIFGSAAYYPRHWISAIAEYDSFAVNSAVSIAPLSQWIPLTVTVGLYDLLEQHNKTPQLTGMVGLGFHF